MQLYHEIIYKQKLKSGTNCLYEIKEKKNSIYARE